MLNHLLTFLSSIFLLMPHLSVSPSSIDKATEKVGWINTTIWALFILSPCDSGSLKWQGFGYDLQFEWFSISHHCHPQIRQWMRSSGTLCPPPHLLSLFNLPHSCPPEISLLFCNFSVPHFYSLSLLILPLTYLYLGPFLDASSHCFLCMRYILGRQSWLSLLSALKLRPK